MPDSSKIILMYYRFPCKFDKHVLNFYRVFAWFVFGSPSHQRRLIPTNFARVGKGRKCSTTPEIFCIKRKISLKNIGNFSADQSRKKNNEKWSFLCVCCFCSIQNFVSECPWAASGLIFYHAVPGWRHHMFLSVLHIHVIILIFRFLGQISADGVFFLQLVGKTSDGEVK